MYKKKKKTRIAMRSNGPQKQVYIKKSDITDILSNF